MTRKCNLRLEASKHVEVSGVSWIIVLCKDDRYRSHDSPQLQLAQVLEPFPDQLSLLVRAPLLPQNSITSGTTLVELHCSLVHSSINDCITVLSTGMKSLPKDKGGCSDFLHSQLNLNNILYTCKTYKKSDFLLNYLIWKGFGSDPYGLKSYGCDNDSHPLQDAPKKELLVLIPFSQLILVHEIQNIFMQEQ